MHPSLGTATTAPPPHATPRMVDIPSPPHPDPAPPIPDPGPNLPEPDPAPIPEPLRGLG
jgi:DNA polymerase-3 subunit gamma/tau